MATATARMRKKPIEGLNTSARTIVFTTKEAAVNTARATAMVM